MNIRIEVVGVNTDGCEQRRQVLMIERQELAMETLGMNLSESKALLSGVQDFVIGQQAHEYLETHRACPHCGERRASKDSATAPVKTVFGPVKVPNPRWKRCSCRSDGPNTFRSMKTDSF
jgi:NADH pyrophosphatase NudC (nudix superfamily)